MESSTFFLKIPVLVGLLEQTLVELCKITPQIYLTVQELVSGTMVVIERIFCLGSIYKYFGIIRKITKILASIFSEIIRYFH